MSTQLYPIIKYLAAYSWTLDTVANSMDEVVTTRNEHRVSFYSPKSDYLKFVLLDVREPHKYVAL